MNHKTKREVIAVMLRAGRQDLARVVAKLFTGHTFDAKELLKRHGARWKPQQKAWDVPDSRIDRAVRDLEANGFEVRVEDDGVRVFRGKGGASRPSSRPASPTSPRPAGRGRATPRQIDYAEKLIDRAVRSGDWFDIGDGSPAPRRQDLERMSTRDISALIDELRSGWR